MTSKKVLSGSMDLLTLKDLKEAFKGKRVVLVGSAPSGRLNKGHIIDQYDCIVRVNNYKVKGIDKYGRHYDYTAQLGNRTDYHFSFYGGSIRKTPAELKADGIKAHLCKCPNAQCHVTEWARKNNQTQGGDFRPLYRRRKGFWIKPVYIPQRDHYLELFNTLNKRVPSTGFYAIWELLLCNPRELYITGFDFMQSKIHNVNEAWLKGRQDDPIRHDWQAEPKLLKKWINEKPFIKCDETLLKAVRR